MNKNNKGFTLIELVATIALLGLIAIISFVSISGVLKESKVKECENLVISIKNAAKEYASDNRYNISHDNEIESLKLVEIGTNKYIEFDASVLNSSGKVYLSSSVTEESGTSVLVNPFTGDNMAYSSVKIRVNLNDDYSALSVIVKNSSDNQINCNNNTW